jgi:hypothetical protein
MNQGIKYVGIFLIAVITLALLPEQRDYQLDVGEDSIRVYDGGRYVGTIAQWNHQQFKNNLKQSTMNGKINHNVSLLIIGLFAIIIALSTSCRAGYGCHGNQSWEKMVRRNNKFN